MLLSVAGLFTVKFTVALCVRLPLVPVTVSVYVPAGVAELVVTDKVEEPEVVTDIGLKLPVAPDGNPLALRFTLPVNPFNALIVVVKVALFPALTVCDEGLAEIEKSGAGP